MTLKEALTFSILLGGRDMYEIIHLRKIIEYEGLRTIVMDYKNNPDQTRDYIKRITGLNLPRILLGHSNQRFGQKILANRNFSIY